MRPPGSASDAENRPLTSIRGIAALWVFSAHAAVVFYNVLPHRLATALLCGWLGVDMFFVLSGFILATVYATLAPAGWPRFFVKRGLRLFPLNTAVILFHALAALLGLATGATIIWRDLPWHLLMLQSFVPGHRVGWIFVNWSVGVELLCYLAFPLVILGLRRLPRAAIALCVLLAAALTWKLQLSVLGSFWDLPVIERCGSEFLLGVATGTLALRSPRLSATPAALLELGAVAALIAGAAGGIGTEFCAAVGSWRMASVPLAAAALNYALASDAGPIACLLRLKPLFWLGQVSFSLYLIHWPLLSRTGWLLKQAAGPNPGAPLIVAWALTALAACLALSALTYRCIELPGRRFAARLVK
jgi:peptidoglycan/LPS O-acetylase OafA/YrhL